jgi:hypothetical protein
MSKFYSFEYQNINTDILRKYTDENLLRKAKGMNWYKTPGYGVLAEIFKRFERMSQDE